MDLTGKVHKILQGCRRNPYPTLFAQKTPFLTGQGPLSERLKCIRCCKLTGANVHAAPMSPTYCILKNEQMF